MGEANEQAIAGTAAAGAASLPGLGTSNEAATSLAVYDATGYAMELCEQAYEQYCNGGIDCVMVMAEMGGRERCVINYNGSPSEATSWVNDNNFPINGNAWEYDDNDIKEQLSEPPAAPEPDLEPEVEPEVDPGAVNPGMQGDNPGTPAGGAEEPVAEAAGAEKPASLPAPVETAEEPAADEGGFWNSGWGTATRVVAGIGIGIGIGAMIAASSPVIVAAGVALGVAALGTAIWATVTGHDKIRDVAWGAVPLPGISGGANLARVAGHLTKIPWVGPWLGAHATKLAPALEPIARKAANVPVLKHLAKPLIKPSALGKATPKTGEAFMKAQQTAVNAHPRLSEAAVRGIKGVPPTKYATQMAAGLSPKMGRLAAARLALSNRAKSMEIALRSTRLPKIKKPLFGKGNKAKNATAGATGKATEETFKRRFWQVPYRKPNGDFAKGRVAMLTLFGAMGGSSGFAEDTGGAAEQAAQVSELNNTVYSALDPQEGQEQRSRTSFFADPADESGGGTMILEVVDDNGNLYVAAMEVDPNDPNNPKPLGELENPDENAHKAFVKKHAGGKAMFGGESLNCKGATCTQVGVMPNLEGKGNYAEGAFDRSEQSVQLEG